MPKYSVGTVPGNPTCIYDERQRPLGSCENVIMAEVICATLNRYVDALVPFAAFGTGTGRKISADFQVSKGSDMAKLQIVMGDCHAAVDALGLE